MRTFGLELLESILTTYPTIFHDVSLFPPSPIRLLPLHAIAFVCLSGHAFFVFVFVPVSSMILFCDLSEELGSYFLMVSRVVLKSLEVGRVSIEMKGKNWKISRPIV